MLVEQQNLTNGDTSNEELDSSEEEEEEEVEEEERLTQLHKVFSASQLPLAREDEENIAKDKEDLEDETDDEDDSENDGESKGDDCDVEEGDKALKQSKAQGEEEAQRKETQRNAIATKEVCLCFVFLSLSSFCHAHFCYCLLSDIFLFVVAFSILASPCILITLGRSSTKW